MRKTTLRLCLVLLSIIPFFFVSTVHGQDSENDINLMDIPEKFGERLGIDTFSAGILCTMILLMIFCLPTGMLIRKHGTPVLIAEIIGLMCFTVAIAWCPVWILIVTCIVIALIFAGDARSWLSGRH